MREIKFRALVKYPDKEATWIYYEPLTIPHAFYAQNDDNADNRAEVIVKNLEYTGLKDKNGTEIYEGDIVKCGDVWEVVWWQEKTRFHLQREGEHTLGLDDTNDIEVVGKWVEKVKAEKR